MSDRDNGLPIEHFIQALTSQLDRAQATMALKARAGLPLTFAVKELSLDLRTHVEMSGSVVRIRPAGPTERETSTLHLQLTTITRPMIEENTFQLAAEPDEPTLEEVLPQEMSEDDRRRLEWVGIHSVSQLRELQQRGGEGEIERFSQIPAMRLRAALERATQPMVTRVAMERPPLERPPLERPPIEGPVGREPEPGPPLLRIRGRNLVGDRPTEVRIGGERLPVIEATRGQLLVRPLPNLREGVLKIRTGPGMEVAHSFRLEDPDSDGGGGEEVAG